MIFWYVSQVDSLFAEHELDGKHEGAGVEVENDDDASPVSADDRSFRILLTLCMDVFSNRCSSRAKWQSISLKRTVTPHIGHIIWLTFFRDRALRPGSSGLIGAISDSIGTAVIYI